MELTAVGFDRREVLKRALLLVGGTVAVSQLGACADLMQLTSAEAAQPNAPSAMMAAVCDTMIPTTDTPGAKDASVPLFMTSMLTNWASAATRERYYAVLTAIDIKAQSDLGKPFLTLSDAQRLDVLGAYDKANIWGPDHSYRDFKQLLLLGYYWSEPGATQELRYEAIPGAWRADIPFTDIGRCWAV